MDKLNMYDNYNLLIERVLDALNKSDLIDTNKNMDLSIVDYSPIKKII